MTINSLDRLSSLPVELIYKILRYVPIRDVVRASVLSTFWRYIWMYVPELVFDTSSIPSSINVPIGKKFADVVNHVLSLHKGDTSRFEIRKIAECYCCPEDIVRWILLLEKKQVKELILELPFWNEEYKFPSSLYCAHNLRLLKLHNCAISLPSHAKGFSNLVSLELNSVTFTNETIASIISYSPLKNLVLVDCYDFTCLNIYSTILLEFRIFGFYEGLNFGNTPNLEYAVMGMNSLPKNVQLRTNKRLEDVLGDLIKVQKLRVLGGFLKSVSRLINRDDEGDYSEQLHEEELVFPRLKTAILDNFEGEMMFLKFILMNAVALDTITIDWPMDLSEERLESASEKILQFQWASPNAELIY